MRRGFAPILALVLIALVAVGYFGYKNYRKVTTDVSPASTPSCKVNCPTPTQIPKPGSIPGWVVYSDPQNGYSFEYPESWYFNGTGGLYNITKEELDVFNSKPVRNTNDYFYVSMNLVDQKLSDYINMNYLSDSYLKYKVVSKTHTFFGKTDVVTYKFCNSISAFMKGNDVQPGKYCTEQSYVDFGNKGFINVALEATATTGSFAKEGTIYKQILSTIKLTQ
jgi:hypothetical protein